jgi:hypothetical protein
VTWFLISDSPQVQRQRFTVLSKQLHCDCFACSAPNAMWYVNTAAPQHYIYIDLEASNSGAEPKQVDDLAHGVAAMSSQCPATSCVMPQLRCVQVRRMAHRYFGPKLVTFADATVDHILVPRSTSDTQSILAHAAGEAWLFSLADFHIISYESAFGRMGAMLACNWDNIVQLDNTNMASQQHNLTYLANVSDPHTSNGTQQNSTAGRRLLGYTLEFSGNITNTTAGVQQCKEWSQPNGPAFCWPEDEDTVNDRFSGKSLRETCTNPAVLDAVTSAWVGIRRR